MKKPETYIFLPSGCVRDEVLIEYLRGGFPDEIRKRIEAHAGECPLCSDALEGYRIQDDPELIQRHIDTLRNRMTGYLHRHSDRRRKNVKILYPLMAAAASVMIVAGILSVISLYKNRPVQELAEQKSSVADTSTLAPEILHENISEANIPEKTEKEKKKKIPAAGKVVSPGNIQPADTSIKLKITEEDMEIQAVPAKAGGSPEIVETGIRGVAEETDIAGRKEITAKSKTYYNIDEVVSEAPPRMGRSAKRIFTKNATPLPEKISATFVSGKYRDFDDYVSKNLVVPDTILRGNRSYGVTLSFTVDTTGILSGIEIAESADTSLNREVVRVVRNSPRWVPAMVAGRPVPEKHTVTVFFKPAGQGRLPEE